MVRKDTAFFDNPVLLLSLQIMFMIRKIFICAALILAASGCVVINEKTGGGGTPDKEAALPGNTPGIFFYNEDKSSIILKPYIHQTGIERTASGRSFRIVSPSEGKFLIMKDIPNQISKDDSFTLTLSQNWTKDIPYISEHIVTVAKIADGKAWLLSKTGAVFVVKL